MDVLHALTTIHAFIAREGGEGGVMWSLALIVLAGVIAIVVGPAVSSDWRNFVGRPLP